MRRPAQLAARGLLAGAAGATVLALWFLLIDLSQGRPFHTPAFLAGILAHVGGVERSWGLIAMYTAVHYGAFFVVGVAVAWVMSKLEVAPTILLGLVLGFLLFDLVFYFGVILTGVDVVRALGWPEVLAGNLLAGIGLLGTLRATMEKRPPTWWQYLAEHRILREGILVGLIGAFAVAAWFFLFDAARREMFFTPGALGSAIFLGVSSLDQVQVNLLTVVGYTALHVAAFIAVGILAAALVTQSEVTPPLVLAALLLFVTFEALFLGLLVIVAEWLLGALAWWTIALGNLVATVAMAYYLWRMHPRLQAALKQPFE